MLPSHICQPWRCIALSTSRLWFCLTVRIRPTMKGRLDCASAWLSRTGNCPLSITMHAWTISGSMEKTSQNIDLPHCRRWQKARTLNIADDLSVIRNNLPLSESSDIAFEDGPQNTDVFEIAPKLSHLCTEIVHHTMTDLRFPWAQLRHCDPDPCTVCQCPEVMRLLPDVVSFNAQVQSSEYIQAHLHFNPHPRMS